MTPWDIQNSNFIFEPILGPILGQFWVQKAKKQPKNQNCLFSLFFVLKIFLHTIFSTFFSEWQPYVLAILLKKNSNSFFKKIPLVPPMDVFSSFGGPRVVAADLSCSRVASVHVTVWGFVGEQIFDQRKIS